MQHWVALSFNAYTGTVFVKSSDIKELEHASLWKSFNEVSRRHYDPLKALVNLVVKNQAVLPVSAAV